MLTVKISPKFQVILPIEIRERLNLKPGQKFQIIANKNILELIPIVDVKQARGFLKGIDTEITRVRDKE